MKLDADLGVAHSYVRFFSFAFHVVEACNQYSGYVLLFKVFAARIPK